MLLKQKRIEKNEMKLAVKMQEFEKEKKEWKDEEEYILKLNEF